MSQDYDIWRLLGEWETGEDPPDDGEGVIDLPLELEENIGAGFGGGSSGGRSNKNLFAAYFLRGLVLEAIPTAAPIAAMSLPFMAPILIAALEQRGKTVAERQRMLRKMSTL